MRSFPEREFKRQMRVNKFTFIYLCTLLGPILKKKDTYLRDSISVECRVAVTLSRLATRNSLRMIGDIYGIGLSTTSKIVRECCEGIKIQLRSFVFLKPTLAKMKDIAFGFEALHDIPFILGAIDGKMPIPYCKKKLINLQEIYKILTCLRPLKHL